MAEVVLRARTVSVEATRDMAAALAELARPGDLLVLVGDLGAGKTAFTQGFGRGLGIDEQITSPTFALVRSYTGRLDLYHLDVYRLDQLAEVADLGLSELLDEGAVTVIEWGDAIVPVLPPDYLEIQLRFDDGASSEDRVVELIPVGAAWSARIRALSTAIGPWSRPAENDLAALAELGAPDDLAGLDDILGPPSGIRREDEPGEGGPTSC